MYMVHPTINVKYILRKNQEFGSNPVSVGIIPIIVQDKVYTTLSGF